MRLVLDTNVLIAAFIARGNCSELLEHCIVHHVVVLSKQILDELRVVLVRKFDYTQAEAHAVVRLLRTKACMVTPVPLPSKVCRDPDDDTILATAVTGKCVAIVTGDKDLTDLKQYSAITIVTPSGFWKFESETIA